MVRLLIFCFLLLLSLLTVFPAPNGFLWYVSIVVTEFPWIFLLAVIVLLCWRFGSGRFEIASIIVGVFSLLLFSYPIIGAYGVSRSLNRDLYLAFPIPDAPAKPYSFWKMIFSGKQPDIAYRSLRYNDSLHYPLTLDYYAAQAPGLRPCVVVIHGGAWKNGDSRQLPELNSFLAADGYQVVSINYRMAPSYTYPAPVDDVRQVLKYLRSQSTVLHIDTSKFVLLGRSAGAQIALVAGYCLQDTAIKGIIEYYGPTDMTWGYQHPSNPAVIDSRKVMEDYLGGNLQRIPAMYDSSSATHYVTHESAPTLMIHGQHDPVVAYDNGTRLSHALAAKGVKNFLLTLPWATHGCDYSLKGPSGQLSSYAVDRFLRSVTQIPLIIPAPATPE